MSLIDQLKNLTRPYDDDEDEFIDEDEGEAEEPVRAARPEKRTNPFTGFGETPAAGAQTARTRSSGTGARVVTLNNTAAQLKLVVVRPERFEQAAEIADHVREKHAIVMNLENTPKDVARRLIDFLSGVAYAQDGKIKRVAANTYVITPYNVDLAGDQMDELENSSYRA